MNLDSFVTFIMIVGFMSWFYGPWQDTCADYARQIIFEERDKLFDMAADGELDFGSQEYKTIRSSLNAAIRFSHEMTIARLLFAALYHRAIFAHDEGSAISESIQRIAGVNIKAKVISIRYRAFAAMSAAMLARSLVFITLCILFLPIICIMAVLYFWWVGFCTYVAEKLRSILGILAKIVQHEVDYEDEITAAY